MKTHLHVGKLLSLLGALYTIAIGIYMAAEGRGLCDAIWWGFMTLTTVGYGDQYPHSIAGRLAGMALVSTAVFIVVPVITASIIGKFADKTDEWTHDEQEEVKDNLRKIVEWMESQKN